MSDSPSTQSKLSALSQWGWMVLALVVFLIFGISTVLLQKQLRDNQENRSQANAPADTIFISKGISNLTAGNETYFELNFNTHGTTMDRMYLEFDVLGDANYMATPAASPANLTLVNSNLKILDYNLTAITSPDTSSKIGWHVMVGVASATFPNGTFTLTAPTPALRFTLTAPTAGPILVVFNQARTYSYISPTPSPVQVFIPDIVFDVAQIACSYNYGEWSACNNGQQTRMVAISPPTCPAAEPSQLTRACLPQCVYVYSDWSTCTNGWQTRTYSTSGVDCTWYQTSSLQPLTQQCETVVPTKDLTTYTYEACWNEQSAGGSSYVIWDKTKFPQATKVDVSTTSNFTNFGNKDITNATSTLNDNYLATDGTNFRTYSDGKQALWVFWPGYTYYFRLYYGDGQHSGVISYFVPKCAGVGGVSYKQCNESCTVNKDCAANLSCVSGQCRRADNSTSTICAALPDEGLNRACNEYCADNKECGSGYTCWWNRCRLPKNLEDVSCKIAPKKIVTTTDYYQTKGGAAYVIPGSTDSAPVDITPEMSCNDNCRTNRDCAAGLRCYQGACRLPTNLTSLTCQSLAEQAASSIAAQVAPTAEPTSVVAPIEQSPATQNNWWSNLAQWLAGRLGFVVLGLLVAVFFILIWPLLRPSSVRSMPAKPISRIPDNDLVAHNSSLDRSASLTQPIPGQGSTDPLRPQPNPPIQPNQPPNPPLTPPQV